MQADNINIPFYKDDVVSLALSGKIQTKKKSAFGENQSIAGVEVFRFSVSDDSSGKPGYITANINHREHQAVAESGIRSAFAAGTNQVGIGKFM